MIKTIIESMKLIIKKIELSKINYLNHKFKKYIIGVRDNKKRLYSENYNFKGKGAIKGEIPINFHPDIKCLIDNVFCTSIFISAKSLSNSFSFFSNAMYFQYNRYLQSVKLIAFTISSCLEI